MNQKYDVLEARSKSRYKIPNSEQSDDDNNSLNSQDYDYQVIKWVKVPIEELEESGDELPLVSLQRRESFMARTFSMRKT